MSENRFDKSKMARPERRTERIPLSAGDLWAHELSAREMMQIVERSQRPSIDSRGGVDRGTAVLWQIVLSCRLGPEPGAELAFTPDDFALLMELPWEEFRLLTTTINRVNGLDPTEAEILRDFTQATRGAGSSH